MKRYFNTEGICKPDRHYMVRLDDRIAQIKKRYIDKGSYFVINRGRQYGKTTTLWALEEYLKDEYLVLSMDFQKISNASYENENLFAGAFIRQMLELLKDRRDLQKILENLSKTAAQSGTGITMDKLFAALSNLCGAANKPVVLLIDEVDSASNNQVFLDFLALLRGYYLDRDNTPAFHSVVLAGVYDIKNLKLKIRPESEHKYNSPWNIAANFNLRMDFSAKQITSMLQEYEDENHSGMDVEAVAECIFNYTSGYPYLVSKICKLIDEEILEMDEFDSMADAWSKKGIEEAVKKILNEKTPLFDSMMKQLDQFSNLRKMLEDIIYQGKRIPYSPDVDAVNIGVMFGFLKEENGGVAIANRIFEMRLLNMFITKEASESEAYRYGQRDPNQFISDGRLDMDMVLQKFVEYFNDIYSDNDERFIEEYGRKFFLLYLKPIINGTGNYYIEARTRDAKRTDVIVDYKGEQFIVELKIWHGNEYNERGEEQLAGYLDFYHQQKGYLLSFNFNKNKKSGMKQMQVGDKLIVEAVV